MLCLESLEAELLLLMLMLHQRSVALVSARLRNGSERNFDKRGIQADRIRTFNYQ